MRISSIRALENRTEQQEQCAGQDHHHRQRKEPRQHDVAHGFDLEILDAFVRDHTSGNTRRKYLRGTYWPTVET